MALKWNNLTGQLELVPDTQMSNINPAANSQQDNSVNNYLNSLYKPQSLYEGYNFKMNTPSLFGGKSTSIFGDLLPRQETLKTLQPKSIVGEIKPIDTKKIDGSSLSTSVSNDLKTTQTGIATKAKFNQGLGIAADLAPIASQLTQGVVTALGGTVADSDMSKGLSAVGNIVGMIPGVGPWAKIGLEAAGAANNIVGGALSKKAGTTRQVNLDGVGSGYGGVTGSNAVMGKTFGFTDKKKMQLFSREKNNVIQQASLAKEIGKQQNQLKMGAVDLTRQNQIKNINNLNGFDASRGLLAKKGTKLTLKNIKSKANYNYSKKHKPLDQNTGEIISTDVTSFADGGKFNLIPEGALHAHKHHIEGVGDITHKGIPVITEEEGGKIEQHAEIEKNEITFHLEVSKELESLHKKYKDGDKSALLEAGKLLTYEILENTVDNTGLIETIS